MYADAVIHDRRAPGPKNRGPVGRGSERYSREIDELDYIVPRGGYYFEHDDRDVWKPKRGVQQQGGSYNRPQPMREPGSFGRPGGDRRPSQYGGGAPRSGDWDRHNGRGPVMSRIGGPSSRAPPPSPSAERPARERERSPMGRPEPRPAQERAAERRRPEDTAPAARPRSTIRSQVHYNGKVSSAPAGSAVAEHDTIEAAPRSRHSDARVQPDGAERDARRNASPHERHVSTARTAERGREPGGAPGRLAGRITSQVVGYDRLQQQEQPGHQQRSSSNDATGRGNGVFQRLGGRAGGPAVERRPMGGMRADAGGKWGHDLFETVNAEPDEKPGLLRKSLLF